MTIQIQSILKVVADNFKRQFGEEDAFYWGAIVFKMADLDDEQMKTVLEYWFKEDDEGAYDIKGFKELYEFITTEFDS